MTTTTMSKLTDRENLQADVITELAKAGQLGVYRVKYEGFDRAALVTITDDLQDPNQVHVTPLAVLCDERMFDAMIPYEDHSIGLDVLGVSKGDLVREHPALNSLRDSGAGDSFEDDGWNPFGNRSAV